MTVKATDAGVRMIVDAVGDSTFHGITVEGHCMGIVGRTWRDPTQAAGYPYACDGARAVADAGRMRTGRPPRGSVVWYSTGGGTYARPGHVLTMEDDATTVGNIGSTIQRRRLEDWTLARIGWCWPEDVPGWGPSPTPGGGTTIDDTDGDDDVYIFQTNADGDGTNGGGAHYIVSHGHAVQCDKGYTVSGDVPRVLSSSEAMDDAFYKSVTRHKL